MFRTFVFTAALLSTMVLAGYAQGVEQQTDQVRVFERRVLELTNIERAKYRLPALVWHDVLASAALAHSEDMLRNNMTGHTGSDGSSPRQRADRMGVTGANSWSENVAYGSATPEAVVLAWMNSPGHKANILSDKSTHLGVGLILRPAGSSATYTHYWTQKFVRLQASAGSGTPAAVVQSPGTAAPQPAAAPVSQPPAPATPAATGPEAAGNFTVIPSTAVRPGGVTFYRQGSRVTPAALPVYNSSGNIVAGVEVTDRGAVGNTRRRAGVWNLRDLDGRPVPAGRYTVRGVLKTQSGETVRVELTVDVR
ncbi:MAG: CAP domain-containing protein [Chitinispirillia bacterium]|nr:CAP domain-containing protein [Chitinispirillia bacterium]